MKEIWRDIKGFEGKYQVSNTGKVKSLNYRRTGKEGIMKASENEYGYLFVELCKDGKTKTCRINRLVAQAFIPNPNNLPEVNHKNEDKTDNRVENLEWCNRSYNVNYGTGIKRRAEKRRNDQRISKPVISVDKVIGEILEFPSIMEASRQTGIDHRRIIDCLKGRIKSAGGYYWHYTSESEEVVHE